MGGLSAERLWRGETASHWAPSQQGAAWMGGGQCMNEGSLPRRWIINERWLPLWRASPSATPPKYPNHHFRPSRARPSPSPKTPVSLKIPRTSWETTGYNQPHGKYCFSVSPRSGKILDITIKSGSGNNRTSERWNLSTRFQRSHDSVFLWRGIAKVSNTFTPRWIYCDLFYSLRCNKSNV